MDLPYYSAFLFLILTSFQMTLGNTIRKAKVVVVGSGMSGIGFAEKLYKADEKDFVILEAKSSPGGRMHDIKFAGYTINLGAGWIHDATDGNPIWLLKKKFGLKTTADNYSNFVVRNDNKQIVNAMPLYTKLKQITNKIEEFAEREQKKKCPDLSMRIALQLNGWNPVSSLEEIIDFYFNDFENANAPWVLSSRAVGFTGQYPDHLVTDDRGFMYVAERLVEPFRSKIQYNTTVKTVKYNSDSVTVIANQNGVDITYTAKYIILTVSTGVLASNNVIFDPKLPKWKMDAVYKVPMGYYTKIFMRFPTKFWDDSFYVLFATKRRGFFCHWQNVDRVGLKPGSKMLLATLTGRESYLVEQMSDKEIIKEAMEQLRKMYGNNIPDASDVKLHRWSKDPLTLGAYSSPSVGVTESVYQALRAPVNKTVWFTGEATDGEYFGYTHGAYVIGQQQAVRFMSCINGKQCPTHQGCADSSSGTSHVSSHILLLICLTLGYALKAVIGQC